MRRTRDLLMGVGHGGRQIVDEGQENFHELREMVAQATTEAHDEDAEELQTTVHLVGEGNGPLSFASKAHEEAFYNVFPALRPAIDQAIEDKQRDLATHPRIKAAWDRLAKRGIGAEVMREIDENCIKADREDDPEGYATELELLVHQYEVACEALDKKPMKKSAKHGQ